MATTNINNVVKDVRSDVSQITYPLDSSGSNDFHQGDLLYWDSAAHVVKALDTDAHAATFVGVALKASDLSLYVNQASGNAVKHYEPSALVGFGCVVSLKTTNAETYNDNVALYIGADAQTVTTVSGTNSIGVVKLRNGQSAVTGAAGVKIDVLLTAKSPIASL
jgi:hypothetical protein